MIRAALWLGLVVQVAAAIWLSHPWLTGDSPSYLALAEGIRHGGYGTFADGAFQADALRPPGYPLLLAAFGVRACLVLQGCAYLLCLYLVQRLVGPLVLVLALAYPFPAFYVATVGTEAWAMLAVTLTGFLLTRADWRSWAAAGLVAGLGAMFRADLLLLPLVVAAFVAWRNWRLAWLPILAGALALAPYCIWNYRHFGIAKPAPLAGALGNSLYIASWQPKLAAADLDALYQGKMTAAGEKAGLGAEVRALNRELGAPDLTPPWNPVRYATRRQQIASVAATGRLALDRIAADPAAYAGHVAANIWALWNTGSYPPLPRAVVAGLRLSSAIVWALAIAGLFVTPRRLWGPLAVFLYVPAVHLWLHTEARYTAPARPLMLMVAALALIAAWQRRRPGPLPAG